MVAYFYALLFQFKTQINKDSEVVQDVARQRNPKRELAKKIWLESKGQKKLKDIADEVGVSASQVRKWKSQDNWSDELNSNVTNDNGCATNQSERYRSSRNNQNAKGNKGNKHASAPPDNKNAVTHGLFANWLPDETKQIIQELYTSDPADIIWNNIIIQYAAIIRAQKIMNVRDEYDHTIDVTKLKVEPTLIDPKTNQPVPVETTREFNYSWDKEANFLQAQSRAISTLSNLIKQFVALADDKDERRLKLQLMQSELDKANGPKEGSEIKDWKQAVIEAANKRAGKVNE